MEKLRDIAVGALEHSPAVIGYIPQIPPLGNNDGPVMLSYLGTVLRTRDASQFPGFFHGLGQQHLGPV
jgi:hypothetical protein